jgi:hypothetical protein
VQIETPFVAKGQVAKAIAVVIPKNPAEGRLQGLKKIEYEGGDPIATVQDKSHLLFIELFHSPADQLPLVMSI